MGVDAVGDSCDVRSLPGLRMAQLAVLETAVIWDHHAGQVLCSLTCPQFWDSRLCRGWSAPADNSV